MRVSTHVPEDVPGEDLASEDAPGEETTVSPTSPVSPASPVWTSLSVLTGFLLATALASVAYVIVIFSFYLAAAPFTFAVACQVAVPVAVIVGIPLVVILTRRGVSRRNQLLWSALVGVLIAVVGILAQLAVPAIAGLPYLFLLVGLVCAYAGRRFAYFFVDHRRWLVAVLSVLGIVALIWSLALWRWF